MEKLFLSIPDKSHEKAYTEMMERWEKLEGHINPSLLRRYSSKEKRTVPYSKWLEWIEDDRTTGSLLAMNVPCTLYFLTNDSGEILGAIEINHSYTHRGHIHVGIAPWNRRKGYGNTILKLALEKCREMKLGKVEICTHKDNIPAIKTIINNGGKMIEEFYEDGICNQRFLIEL